MAPEIVGIGNAIVDVIAEGSDAFLEAEGLVKGGMALIDEATAQARYSRMGPGIEMSGGSVANTMAGIASLGGRAAFLGKVADDALGTIFRHDIQSLGVSFPTAPASASVSTARCLITVSPDGQRTMSTYLGACTAFGPADVDHDLIAGASILYLEGYLFDPPLAKQAFRDAVATARASGAQVALSLSDAFCVARHRSDFLRLLDDVDILFANEHEAAALFPELAPDVAARQVAARCPLTAITAGPSGSTIYHDGFARRVAAERVACVDSTGAGDLYAAGFLHAIVQGLGPEACGRLGSICAAEAISHYGARPMTPLRDLSPMNNHMA